MVKEKLTQILVDELEIDAEKISLDAHVYDDLGIDSLDVVDMVVLIQEEFGVKLQAQDLKGIKTFGDLVKLIEQFV
jgi:acyl carrier protein